MDDPTNAAQQQINDAAKKLDPSVSGTGTPPLPEPPATAVPSSITPPPSPPETLAKGGMLKEEALLSEPSTPSPPSLPSQLPVPPPQPETATFGPLVPSEETPPPQPAGGPPPKKKGVSRGLAVAIVFLLLATIPVAVFYVSKQQQQIAETRSRAASGSCQGSPPPNCKVSGFAIGGCGGRSESNCRAVASCGCSWVTSGGGSTLGVPDGQSSGCCSGDGQCVSWFGAGSTCTNPNGACASGKQCKGGAGAAACGQTCTQTDCGRVICAGTQYQQTCNAGCKSPCGDGICGQGETYQSCSKDCKSPLGILPGGTLQCQDGNNNRDQSKWLICECANGCSLKTDTSPGGGGTGWVCDQKCRLVPVGTQPSGTCTQIDYVHQGTDSYCGVAQINCPTSCQKTGAAAIPIATSTPTPIPLASQCLRIKVYKDATAVEPTTLVAGDQVTLAVGAANASKGRIRVNGAAFTETTTKNTNNEFTVPFTVPSEVTSFTVEAEVFGADGQWR